MSSTSITKDITSTILSRKDRRLLKRRLTPSSPPPATPTKYTTQMYSNSGVPSPPKNPINGTTTAYDTALDRVMNNYYGKDVSDEYNRGDLDTVKQLIFLAGRDWGNKTYIPEVRNEKILKLIGWDQWNEKAMKRFNLLLITPCDRNLLNQTIGAEMDQEIYLHRSEARGKTYKQCYGELIVAILRYVQQDDAYGFLSDEDMEKLVFFFRFQFSGTCYLAAVCIISSYLGQMASDLERVICPPDVGNLIRSFKDEDFYNHVIDDAGRDSQKVLKDILKRCGKQNCQISVHTEQDFNDEDYDLKKKITTHGPALVTNFKCTLNFHQAYAYNPACSNKIDEVNIGYIKFDMQEGQKFEDVEGVYSELRSSRGSSSTDKAEIENRLRAAEDKTNKKSSLFDQSFGNTTVGSPNVGRGGDRSAHTYSPPSSPDSIHASPQRDRTTTRHYNTDLDDSRDLAYESIEALDHGESGQSQIRDRPPVMEHDEIDESESSHAMVCIGGRVDKKGKTFMLLHNSWSRMPLVEVSLNYFIAAEASLATVSKKDHNFFKNLTEKNCFYKVNKAFVADCSS